MPPTIESSENRTEADANAGGSLPVVGQDMGATADAGGGNKTEGLNLVSLVRLDTECAVPGFKCARSSDNQWWPASLKAGYGGLCSKLATTPD